MLARDGVVVRADRTGQDSSVSGLAYDRAASARLERAYTTADAQEQRDAVRRALRAAPGEWILDLGSGPGILACEPGREVGPNGMIAAVDISPEMKCDRLAQPGRRGLPIGSRWFEATPVRSPFPMLASTPP
jgi:hypothetical protein